MSEFNTNSGDNFLDSIKQSFNKIVEEVEESKREYINELESKHSKDLAMKDRLITFVKEYKLISCSLKYGMKFKITQGGANVFEQNELVFEIKDIVMHKDRLDYYLTSPATRFKATSFKKKGIWAKFLLGAWKILQIEEDKQKINSNYREAKNIKDKFQE